jgi:hypothetical protein
MLRQNRRTFFLTENERTGIGSTETEVGDEGWLLFGGRVLYVLRPVDNHFKFIGECYVHGYIEGEGMELRKAGKLKDEWVELR